MRSMPSSHSLGAPYNATAKYASLTRRVIEACDAPLQAPDPAHRSDSFNSHFQHVKSHVEHTAYLTIRNNLMNYARTCLSTIGVAHATGRRELGYAGIAFGFYGVLTFSADLYEHRANRAKNDQHVQNAYAFLWMVVTAGDGLIVLTIVILSFWAIQTGIVD